MISRRGRFFISVLVFLAGAFRPGTGAAQTVAAQITYPANGAANADLSQPIQWTTVANAQAYYLYVGTSLGTNNLVNTGEVHQTSYASANLPVGQTVYARLYTYLGGVWLHADSTFRVGPTTPVTATITYPANGATNADLSQPIQWTTVANAQAYYLYVGSTLGTNDLVNTGEILQTSYATPNLPTTGQTVYVRLHTLLGGVWRSTDSKFSMTPLTAVLSYPTSGAQGVTTDVPFTWNVIPNVDAYFLYIGTTPGAQGASSSGEVNATAYSPPFLTPYTTLYARLYTEVGGVWRQAPDVTFVSGSLAAQIVLPVRGSMGVPLDQPFEWTTVSGAQGYRLVVSSTAAGSDILDTGTIQQTTYTAASLPADRILYARVYTLLGGNSRFADTVFTLMPLVPPADISYPTEGMTGVDTGQPLQWNAVGIADGYRMELGTSPGAHDLHDSGTIRVTRRFVPGIPIGVAVYGRLSTRIGGQWYPRDFTFAAGSNTIATSTRIDNALWATHAVRSMSLALGSPFIGTELADVLSVPQIDSAACTDYANELVSMLAQMNIGLPVQLLNVALNPNHYDTHTLVEIANDQTQRWMLFDPTFDLSVKRTATGDWATAEDVSTATRALLWGDVSYFFLGSTGDAYVRGYYIDYPLLYVNVYHNGVQPDANAQSGPVIPYMEELAIPSVDPLQARVVGCSGARTADLDIDGGGSTVSCDGVDSLSHVFVASTIATNAATSASVKLYRPRRYVF